MNSTKMARGETADYEQTDVFRQRWPLLIGCHLALGGAVSPVFAAVFGLFLPPMSADLHWSRGQLALGMSTFVLASTLATPLSGYLLDRFGARMISLASALCLPLALVLFGLSPGHAGGYLAASALVGLVGTLTLPVTYVSILPQWFDKRLGLAMALVVSGLGTGAIASAAVASRAIAHFGWQGGWFALAAWSALLVLAGRSLVPWGQVRPRAKLAAPAAAAGDPEARRFSTDVRFWLFTLAFMLGLMVTLGVQTNVGSVLTDRGLSPGFIATTIAVTGAASMIARLLGGALLDWFAVRIVGGATFACQASGCLLIAFAPSPIAAMAGAALVSFAYGVEADMIPYVIRRRYGLVRFGRIYGVMYGLAQFGAMIGPAAVAATYDRSGAYTGALVALAACSATASLILMFAGTTGPRAFEARPYGSNA